MPLLLPLPITATSCLPRPSTRRRRAGWLTRYTLVTITLSSSTLKKAAMSRVRSLIKSISAVLLFRTTSGSNVNVSL